MKRIFIIGEIGINHNGDINIAKKLIDLAKKAGADAVKFQKRDIELVYSKKLLDSPRESPWGKTQRDQKLGLEFNYEEYKIIDDYCKQNKIIWFASAWDINSLKFLEKFNLNFNKIASAMIIDKNFLKAVAKQKKYTFISTGMSTEKNIDDAVKIFTELNCPFELMHSVSTYPMDPKDANLSTITELKKKYKCDVGYSGHESGVAVSLGAAALGISSLERHITLDRAMYGSDQSASLAPSGFMNLVESSRKIQLAMGKPSVGKIIEDEILIAEKLRAHIKI